MIRRRWIGRIVGVGLTVLVVTGAMPSPVTWAQVTRRLEVVPHAMRDPAHPDPATDSRCRQYAGQATMGAKRAVEWHCKLTGPLWSTDENAHYRWCLSAAERDRSANHEAQKAALDRCDAGRARRID